MERREWKLLFLGPPLAGKGTQCRLLSKQLAVPHISSGDLLRKEMEKDTKTSKYIKSQLSIGALVSDEVINELIKKEISEIKGGFILDGYPRTIEQLNMIDFEYDMIILLNTSLEDILDRASGRLYHPPSGRIYHKKYSPPKVVGLDDVTGEELQVRDDDKVHIIKRRFMDFIEKTGKVVEKGMEMKKLAVVDGSKGVEEINRDILALLGK